ncbi:MAG: methyltransferase [Treponema sp. GWB1_62_6]|nr:MAG: methyltransferase [Treponema sp. GWB1_62_6]OHE67708.1 MAG: methyltransferase [Treponema sp. GWC1_61_84]OHE71859.1 MAG: methyltransferase [Treponema sp. RIFOXYC1_FULL_61_9]HCM29039.1 class I SAM-dependent methyltransferase [Treponema sp.]
MRPRKRDSVKTWSTPRATESARFIPCALCGGRNFLPDLDCGGFGFVRCSDCGLLQSNPQSDSAEVRARYGERHGEDYLAYELANEAPFLRLQQLALSDAGFDRIEAEARKKAAPSAPKVLDVGCATGALLETLRARGWDCSGVELCGESAAWAREKRCLDVRSLPIEEARYPGGSFDLVHASHLIEHLNEPRSFLRESLRVLKKDGILLLTTPNADGLQARLFGSAWRSAIFDHLYLFSRSTIRALLESEGFGVEKIVTWGGLAAGTAPRPIKALADRAAKRFSFGDVMLILSRARADHSP